MRILSSSLGGSKVKNNQPALFWILKNSAVVQMKKDLHSGICWTYIEQARRRFYSYFLQDVLSRSPWSLTVAETTAFSSFLGWCRSVRVVVEHLPAPELVGAVGMVVLSRPRWSSSLNSHAQSVCSPDLPFSCSCCLKSTNTEQRNYFQLIS